MAKVYKIETTVSQDLAELYESLMAEFERRSSMPLADMNRAVLQTGMIHHLTMMCGLGLIEKEKVAALDELVDKVAQDTIMWDLVQMARSFWRDCGDGTTGIIDLTA
ncbi:MAG: hypothetical protein QGH25_18660 [Candidatus Latescibacteria bacterium]|jgi:hypothetical protein|nr:hypothetical protein [Candidatus Latescibacterota bacterium]